ncbi:MAG: PilZ domain-containing protein [Gammaproteobacteria bacterium]|nr:MAG: PilZ domain-containing protein [Gammaproteobacteria bacterium]
MEDTRTAKRMPPARIIDVVDSISGRSLGHIGNLSADGMLLISPRALPANTLYQVSFKLPAKTGFSTRAIEIGVHEQWGEAASAPGQFWTGFRIIDISPEDQERLNEWVSITRT